MPVSYGASEESVTVTGWNALSDGSRGNSAAIDNSSNLYHAVDLEITVDTGASAPSAGAHFEVWLEPSTDGGTTFGEAQGVFLGSIESPTASNTQRRVTLSTDAVLAILPRNYRIALVNRTGQTSGSDTSLNLRGKKAA